MLANLKPDHSIFSVIDIVVYFLIFILLSVILRLALRRVAKDEADESFGKCVVTVMLILVIAAFSATYVHARTLGYFMAIPVVVIGVVLIRLLCWVSFPKAAICMLVLSLSAGGLVAGSKYALDQILPKDRKTMVKRVQISMGLLDGLVGRESEAFFTKDTFKTIRAGLAMNAEAMKSAVALLRDPGALDAMVADHQEDLHAMGLIVDGETNSVEQLAELGIVYEPNDPAKRGIDVLQNAGEKKEFSEEDVENVMLFLQSVRKDKSEVTATDAAIVIREAMKRAQTYQTNVIAGVRLGDLAAGVTNPGLPFSPSGASGAGAGTSTGATVSFTPPAGAIAAKTYSPRAADPLSSLHPEERAAWRDSKTGIVVNAIMRYLGTEFLVKVNDKMLGIGETITIESNGRAFEWRLVDANDYSVSWEPVFKNPRDADPSMIYRF